MSPAHFSRRFRAAYGETPYGYLMTRRIERAMALLRAGASVTDACMAVGCTSLGSFSSRFAEIVGETPTAYRSREHDAVNAMPACVAKAHTRPVRTASSRIGEALERGRGVASAVMTISLQYSNVTVNDVDESLAFYGDALGLEVQNDVASGRYRWVTLGSDAQPGLGIVLSEPHAGRSKADGDAMQELLTKGVLPMLVFATDDIDATFETAARLRRRGPPGAHRPADGARATARSATRRATPSGSRRRRRPDRTARAVVASGGEVRGGREERRRARPRTARDRTPDARARVPARWRAGRRRRGRSPMSSMMRAITARASASSPTTARARRSGEPGVHAVVLHLVVAEVVERLHDAGERVAGGVDLARRCARRRRSRRCGRRPGGQ